MPGDPDDVGREATDYGDIAGTIKAQAYRLRRMSESDDDLRGHYVDEIKSSMADVADQLDDVHHRFLVTSQQLTLLEPALETARSETRAALDLRLTELEEAAEEEDPEPRLPGERTPAQKKAQDAMEAFNTTADSIARKIREAADDDMKDSRWDRFKSVIDKIAPFLKALKVLITIAIVVLAVVALFIPGLNMIVLGLILASLAINLTLASTGNGSWTDVWLDLASLATFGLGSAIGALAKGGRLAFLSRPASSAARAAFNGNTGLSRFSQAYKSFKGVMDLRKFTMASGQSGTLREIVKSGFNRDMVQFTRSIADIQKTFPAYNPSRALQNTWTMANGGSFAININSVAGLPSAVGAVRD
ncbi:hypothetical protein HMPREF0063_12294 [Aeromicrobium marinum DSM 15272]|uniref:Uncharacterized protein n=1 Tax=Aeromicrobium marinum DSM 15272 TaxID=585531 RepID=E2SCY2_9ACTN|nr:hypothetical protein HMPREF0063_12294 [Aeromicrobium marinum DSM 15272]